MAEKISLKGLLTHAEKNGVDQVAETAAELSGMTEETLAGLIEKLDAINEGFRRDPRLKKLHRPRKNRYPADRRARELMGIPEPEPDPDLAKPSQTEGRRAGKIKGQRTKETASGKGTRRKGDS